MVEAGGSRESAEDHGRGDFGSGKGAEATGIWQAWREREKVGGEEHGKRRIKGEEGNISMMGQRQVTPRWADDTVR